MTFLATLVMVCALEAPTESVAPSSLPWRYRAQTVRTEHHLGREAIYLANGYAELPNAGFDTGIIEFDLASPPGRAFLGLAFRMQGEADYEHLYIRTHQSGNPDASQYTPVFGSVTGWQIYAGERFSGVARFRFNEWMRVRFEIAGDSARVFVDDTLVLSVPDLMRDRLAGGLALTALEGGAHFSNVRITPSSPPPVPSVRAPHFNESVQHWVVSPAMPERDALTAARRSRTIGKPTASVEPNGILNIARHARWSRENDTALASFSLWADSPRHTRMRFGFSDKVRVLLNGALLYDGDDTRQSRDYRFLGTVGLYDALHLPLRRGRNIVTFVVTENHGGWAAAAALEPAESARAR